MSRKMDKARAAVTNAEARLKEWRAKAETLSSELTKAEKNLGSVAVETGDLDSASRSLSDLRGRAAAAGEAVRAAEAGLTEAQRGFILAEADDLSSKAKKLRRDADKRQSQTDMLLKELTDFEGCTYTPAPQDQRAGGVVLRGGVASDYVTINPTPKTQQIRNEAADLDRQAADLRRKAAALEPSFSSDRMATVAV